MSNTDASGEKRVTGTSERREQIIQRLRQQGSVQVNDLSALYGVSTVTIRNDLAFLEKQGIAVRAYGGALICDSTTPSVEPSVEDKSALNTAMKRSVAKAAVELIQPGHRVILDSGTTSFETASYLRSKRGLTVIVNSIRTAQELTAPGVRVLLLGGHYRPDRMDAVGPMAGASLERLRGYRAFFGSDGLAMDFGPTSIDVDSAALISQAVANAQETVLLVDNSKFGSPALYRIVEWNQVSTIVTDQRPDEAWTEFLNEQGIKVIFPQRSASASADEPILQGQTYPQEP
ncbi:MAG: DeoR family transcriptional regulator [Planctomycetes bacterium]|nr:DeoR family transcriptional regulator [Planctomycetota bacterium]